MGGKGGSEPPFSLSYDQSSTDYMGPLMEIFGGMMEMNAGLIETMGSMANQRDVIVPEIPSIFEAPDIDWTEENQKLQQKVKADQEIKDKQKRGRASTIISSPLLDEEDATTTQSLLGK